MTVHEEVNKHRPNGHYDKDNNGFRRETEMSSRHTQPFYRGKTQHHADWRKPAEKKGGLLINVSTLKTAALWLRKVCTLPHNVG
ncbi:hypothetical protein [Enterobacter mori]|uniref:hypothetical protein n=1 Tax=Enterobacter mori TaxID=539813 RepID=UPI000302211C|nr:hypothetical protein [Enterobacter mori]